MHIFNRLGKIIIIFFYDKDLQEPLRDIFFYLTMVEGLYTRSSQDGISITQAAKIPSMQLFTKMDF